MKEALGNVDFELSVTTAYLEIYLLYIQKTFPECSLRFKPSVRPWVEVMFEDMREDERESKDRRKY